MEKIMQHQTIGLKYDGEKPRMALLPFEALEEIAKILTFGAKKYAPNNWQYVDNAMERYENALLRHLAAIHKGEEFDTESGLSHYGHAGCCMLFMIWKYLESKGLAKTPTINIENRIDPHKTLYNEDGSINEDIILESLCETKVYTREGA